MWRALNWLTFGCFSVRQTAPAQPALPRPATITIERRAAQRPTAASPPIRMVMIVDTSISMKSDFRPACSALVHACQRLRRTLDGRPCLLTWYTFDYSLRTHIVEEDLAGIESISVTGSPDGYGTRLFGAIVHACRQNTSSETIFFLVTDGVDGSDKSLYSADDVAGEIKKAKQAGANFVSFTVGPRRAGLRGYMEGLGFLSSGEKDHSRSVDVGATEAIDRAVSDTVWNVLKDRC